MMLDKDDMSLNEIKDYTVESIYPPPFDASIDIKDDKYSIFEYLRKIGSGKIIMNPEFQRNKVWKPEQKSQFIESVILNIPIPPIYVKAEQKGQLIVVDGLQRTNTLIEFMSNQLTLKGLKALKPLNGRNYESLKNDSQLSYMITRIEDKQLYFYTLDYRTPMNVVYDIFNRINTGGTKLDPQEVRNCVLIGNSTKLLKRLSESRSYRDAINNGISGNRMKDREAALRCIAFTLNQYKVDYKGRMDEFLERTMRKLNKMSESEVDEIERNFNAVMDLTLTVFGNKNFRIPSDNTCGMINIAVMETVFYVFHKLMATGAAINNEDMKQRFAALLKDEGYINSVRSSTSSMSKVMTRFDLAEKYFEK